jgi:nitroimidazol reductase NimA-like FMN-containing flavoprotein (pyridoxamine 5'-phosphate oxidase superfamily)
MNDFRDVSNQDNVSADPQSFERERIAFKDILRQLIGDQFYAVLCTQGQSQPYGSLVAFAVSDDLKQIVFSTPIESRKYRLLTESDQVALVIDSRSISSEDLMKIEAVTATGRARTVPVGPEFEHFAGILVDRHPKLRDFVNSESSALVCIEVNQYFHVGRFQELRQWTPITSGASNE